MIDTETQCSPILVYIGLFIVK